MLNIGLIPVDSNYPNLALMKISAWHKKQGDSVVWYSQLEHYDKAYLAKIFSFTPDYSYYIQADKLEKGGTGYDLNKKLPELDDWREIGGKLYCPDCYEHDEEIDEYKPKKKEN